MPRVLPVEQLEVVRQQLVKGLQPKEIAGLKLPVLNGYSLDWYYWAARKLNMRITVRGKAAKLTDGQEDWLADFLLKEGQNLPASLIRAKMAGLGMNVTEGIIHRRRIAIYGKPDHRIHRRKPEDSQHASIGFAKKRSEQHAALCRLQTELENSGCTAPWRTCEVCGDERFELAEFFFRWVELRKNGSRLCTMEVCRICMGERALLRRMGKTAVEARTALTGIYAAVPVIGFEQLESRMLLDAAAGCADKRVPCRRCRIRWFWNSRYFHQASDGSGKLTEYCLACPTGRKFFHL